MKHSGRNQDTEKCHSSNQIPSPSPSVLRKTAAVRVFSSRFLFFLFLFLFSFFFIDIAVKYVTRTFQAAIQLPLDMRTPCRVSSTHLSPCNTPWNTMQVVSACSSIEAPSPFLTFAFHFRRNDSARICAWHGSLNEFFTL